MTIAGVDEAGRGALAGPVVVAAVILAPDLNIEGLTDSKKLSPAKRQQIVDELRVSDSFISVAIGSRYLVDRVNVLNATLAMMSRAVRRLAVLPDEAYIDGNRAPHIPQCVVRTFVGGDALYPCISAASVVAKVCRDRLMHKYDRLYPDYGFSRHKGYGTNDHYECLFRHGPSVIHRRSFNLSRQETLLF